MTTPSSRTRSPHVLNLADQLASLEGEVAGSIETVRGTVETVLQEPAPAAVAPPVGAQAVPAQQLAEQRLAAAERPAEPSPPPFQPTPCAYFGATCTAETPAALARVHRRERANERLLRTNPSRLLANYAGAPDAAVTAARYAAAIQEHVAPTGA